MKLSYRYSGLRLNNAFLKTLKKDLICVLQNPDSTSLNAPCVFASCVFIRHLRSPYGVPGKLPHGVLSSTRCAVCEIEFFISHYIDACTHIIGFFSYEIKKMAKFISSAKPYPTVYHKARALSKALGYSMGWHYVLRDAGIPEFDNDDIFLKWLIQNWDMRNDACFKTGRKGKNVFWMPRKNTHYRRYLINKEIDRAVILTPRPM